MRLPRNPTWWHCSVQTRKEAPSTSTRMARSGGWLVACTPEGYILHAEEFQGAESLSQRYFFVVEIKAAVPSVKAVIHDDACHLRKFASAREQSSVATKTLTYPSIKYVMDRVHSKGHADPWCLQHCHPDAPETVTLLEGKNASVCEQLFSKTNRYGPMVRSMRRWTCVLFTHEVIAARNQKK